MGWFDLPRIIKRLSHVPLVDCRHYPAISEYHQYMSINFVTKSALRNPFQASVSHSMQEFYAKRVLHNNVCFMCITH